MQNQIGVDINRLIQDLFELAKAESYQTSFVMSPVAASILITDIYKKYSIDVRNAGFRLDCKGTIDHHVMVSVDSDRLDQVFANLIANALRYMKRGGQIAISCELLENWLEGSPGNNRRMILFKVADDGKGIAVEDIPFVFDRFYQASKARDVYAPNTGLGLAIVKEIVGAHGGSIWVDETVQQGCTICFTLPEYIPWLKGK